MVAVQTATALLSRVTPTLAPALAAERGWSDSVVGYLSSLGTLGSILFLAAGAPLMRRLGSIRSLQTGLVLGILGLLLLLPPTAAAAGLASLLIGIGYGPSSPAGNDVLHRTAPPERRAMIFSIKQAGVPVGGVLSGIMIAPIAAAYGWRASLVVVGLCVAAVILAAQPMRGVLDAGRARDQRLSPAVFLSPANLLSPLKALTESTSLFRLAAAGTCLAFGQGIWFGYLVTYAVSVLGYDLASAGVLFAIMQGASFFGRIGLGWLADKLGSPRQLLAFMGLTSGLTTLAWAFAGPHWPYWAVCALAAVAGVTATSWNGVQLSEVARACPPGRVREASAGATLVIFLGYVAGPSGFATLLAITGRYEWGLALFACFGLLAFVVMPRERGPQAPKA
jgi:MFS family permease